MNRYHLIFILLLTLISFQGCNRRGSGFSQEDGYRLSGSVVKNLDTDQLVVTATLKRNDTTFNRGVLTIGTDTLENTANQYILTLNSASALSAGDYYLKINDTALGWVDSVAFTIPANFQITDITGVAEDRVFLASDIAYVSFSVSLQSDGYLYTAVLNDQTYSGQGTTEFVTEGATQVSYTPREIEVPDTQADTNRYFIYIYSYTGSPSTSSFLPARLADGLTDNIDRLDFKGNFGAVLITPRDSLIGTSL